MEMQAYMGNMGEDSEDNDLRLVEGEDFEFDLEPRFLQVFRLARSCCCGCLSLKTSMVIITLIDITMGIASIGLVYGILKYNQF